MITDVPTRITTPTPTRGSAPSHSPPDVRYAPGIDLARALGWFSIGLGCAEIMTPGAVSKLTGVRRTGLVQAFGFREVVTGLGILNSPQPAGWLWGRVAGDLMDLAILNTARTSNGHRRSGTLESMAAVAGVTALDVLCGLQLSAAAALEG